MALVIKDPEEFHIKGYNVPKLEDLRLFTAGSDSTDLVERCLVTGRILVSPLYHIRPPIIVFRTKSLVHRTIVRAMRKL